MDVNNKRYARQGIHGVAAIFSVIDGEIKVLLIKRTNEPYKGKWILTGGAIYNDEDVDSGTRREVYEKTGIKAIYYEQFGVYSEVYRSPVMRMIAISYIALIDSKKIKFLKNTSHTEDADWFNIYNVPELGYDHTEILKGAIQYLKKIILKSNIVKNLLPNTFTLPELQKIYEVLLGVEIDRRNFRKKILSLNLLQEAGLSEEKKVGKPAKRYKFRDKVVEEKSLF